MASSTRSGRILKHEGTSSTRSSNAAAKVKKLKYPLTSGSTTNSMKNTRSLATSDSAATISSSLRKSSRETPTKKMAASSPGSRRSERVENQIPYKKSEGLDKKRSHSPLRRSQRIEKNGISSSPGSKTLDMSSSPPMKKQKLDDKHMDAQSCGTSKKKSRLNARRYRQLLQPKKDECSDDDGDTHLKDDHASKGNSSNSASSNSKKVHEGLDESNGRKEDKFQGKYSADSSKEAADGSSSSSRELAELTTGNDRLKKSARLSLKKEFEDKSPVSNCSDSSLQSCLVGLINKDNVVCASRREIHGADDTHDTCKLDIEELEFSGLVASTSEVKSLAVDRGPECTVDSKGSKNAETAADLDSDLPVTAGSKEICISAISKTVVTSLSPCETTSKDIKRCTVCNKPLRVHSVPEAHETCLCDAQIEHDLVSSVIEEPSELVSNPCEIDVPATCYRGNNVKGNPIPEAREHLSGSEKQNHLVTSLNKEIVSGPTSEDRGTFGVSGGTCTSEEHLRITHLKESLVAVQMDSDTNACVVCKHPGRLLCCDGKGCKRSYHLSCLNPPLLDIPPGVWLCHLCVRKKVESGVHSVSEGIEAIWDVIEGMQNGKHYFVKYKGLAHVHNEWVSESRILLEVPMLLAKFGRRRQKEKGTRWKQDWTEPHRLLQKRLLLRTNLADEYLPKHGDKFLYCYHEWLVKWKGLGYENATWELENSQSLCSPVARALISDFESRHEEAKKRSDPLRVEKALQVKKSPIHKLTRLPDDCLATLDNDHLHSVNRLREFWHRSQNAVFVDDQERIIKSVLFVSALKSHTCQPILVISTVHSLSLWETEFSRLAPSINVVLYTGTKDIRKLIRTVEFYAESGCVMFQVLLSHPDAIIEDFDALDCIGWEALIIDECQNPRVSKHLEQYKNLSTEFKLLLLSAQLKDSVADYLNLLSFLESGGKKNGSNSLKYGTNNSSGALAILKEKLTHYLAYERKLGSSKFLEYWVPVQLSNVQLEQYCSTLVSNLSTLRSSSKVDHVGALRDILISTRKCCDHPYLVGRSLQSSLIKVLPSEKLLDIGVKVSGKLHLLDKFLHEIKNQGLRVLILFQSIGGAGKDSIGDILDDFICQRFGPDSYERVDSGLIISKKLAALSKFNDKAKGRFVFLIENRACLPSIKLSSVDVVVIFDSDWNPLNDLRALQRIHIESQFEHVKVFRLYSSCTVEEKVLIFAKHDLILDSNIQSISPSNSHLLLSWGAFHLFNELDKFHQHDTLYDYSENSIEKCFLNDSMLKFQNDVMVELVKELSGKAESNFCECLLLIKAQQSGSSYSRNISLVGERDGICSLDKDPPSFWLNLLEKRYPKWRFISETSQRIRRKVQHFEESFKVPEVENDEVRKKRRKLTTNTVDPICLQTWLEDKTKGLNKESEAHDDISHSVGQLASVSSATTLPFPVNMTKEPGQIKFAKTCGSQSNVGSQCVPNTAGIMNHVTHNLQASLISDDDAELHKFPMSESEGRCNAQKTLHLCLKPELSELCDTLKLPDDVKGLARMLLEYIMNNHHVSREPETILQAFKLSLCWRAASFLKYKVDHKECLALAKKYLNYTCNVEQAGSVYSKLRMLKKKISQSGAVRHEDEPKSLENQSSSSRKTDIAQQRNGGTSESASSCLLELGEIEKVSDGHRSSGQSVLEQEQVPDGQSPIKMQQNLGSLKDVLLQKRVDLIDIVCSKREDAIVLKQQVELSDFNVHREEERLRMKSAHNDHLELIRSVHTDYTIKTDKIKLLNQEFSKKMAEFDRHMQCQRRKFAAMQEDVKKKERYIRNSWMKEAKAGNLAESFDTLPLTESGFRLEEFKEVTEQFEACDGSSIMSVSRRASDSLCGDIITTVPEVPIGITENDIENRSTFCNGMVEDVQHFASNSSKMAELDPLQPIVTSAETLETVLPDRVEVEYIDSNRTSAKIPGSASDLMCSDVITAVPQMSTETTENQPDMSSSFSIRKGEDLHCPASQASSFAEAEPVQPKTTSPTEIAEIVFPGMVEVEAVEPNDPSAEVPKAILPAGDGDMSKDTEFSFSDSEVMNVFGNQPNTMHMVPLQRNGMTAEIPETVPSNMVELESSAPTETSLEIPATILPAAQDVAISENSGTLFSDSDVRSVLGNPSETMHMVPSITTSLPRETRTPVFVSNNMVEEGYLEVSAGVPVTISSPEVGDICREAEAPPSQMMDTGSSGTLKIITASTVATAAAEINIHRSEDNLHGTCLGSSPLQNPAELPSKINKPQEILNHSAVATAAAASDRDAIEGKVNSDGTYLRPSPLLNPVNLPTISRGSTNSCGENSVSSNLVSSLSEHGRRAVAVGTESEEGLISPNTAPVSFDVVTSQVGPTAAHTKTLNSTRLQVPPVENLSSENGQESTPRSLRSEGEIHTEGTHSSQLTALSMQQPNISAEMQAEEFNQLAPQSVLHPAPPAETVGTEREVRPESCCLSAQTEVPVQQPIATAAVQADQSNQLVSQSVVHPPLPSANLLPERARSEGNGSTGVPQEAEVHLLQILPMAAWVHPQALHPDPLQNELMRIRKQVELRTKMHEDKKLQLKLECEQEIERVRKKYDGLIKDDEAGFHQDKKILETIYNKVLVNQILAEEFRAKFIDTKGGPSASFQGRSSNSTQQFLQTSQALHAPRPSSTAASVHVPVTANLPPVATPARASSTLPSAGALRAQVPAGSLVTPGLMIRHGPSVIPTNNVRSQFNPMLPARPNLQGVTDVRAPASRAPAPHLQRFRPHTSMMAPILPPQSSQVPSQQRPNSNLGSATLAAASPPVHLPRSLLGRTFQPVASGPLSHSNDKPLPSVELPRDLGDASVDLSNRSPSELRPLMQGRFTSNLPVNRSETAPPAASSTIAATRPTSSAADLVCLSDDE